jgi:hypothetical protein
MVKCAHSRMLGVRRVADRTPSPDSADTRSGPVARWKEHGLPKVHCGRIVASAALGLLFWAIIPYEVREWRPLWLLGPLLITAAFGAAWVSEPSAYQRLLKAPCVLKRGAGEWTQRLPQQSYPGSVPTFSYVTQGLCARPVPPDNNPLAPTQCGMSAPVLVRRSRWTRQRARQELRGGCPLTHCSRTAARRVSPRRRRRLPCCVAVENAEPVLCHASAPSSST